jgi:uncharacterized protein YjbJ (UPF0337 family)
MVNQETLKGKWNEIKGEMKKIWGNLTDNDLEKSKGDFTSLVGLVQQQYGLVKEDAERKLTEIVDRTSRQSKSSSSMSDRDDDDMPSKRTGTDSVY